MTAPAAAVLAWQTVTAASAGWSPYRAAAIAVALGAAVWGCTRRDSPIHRTTRAPVCVATAAVFWLSVLEISIGRSIVLARGVLLLLALCGVHATVLLALTRDRAARPRGAVALRIGLSASTFLWLAYTVELICGAIAPPTLYELVPDDPAGGRGLRQHPAGFRIGQPGFRGSYVHPEFAGTRVAINAWGFRDEPRKARSPAPDQVSVVALGDSFVFGTGVQLAETFHHLIEADPTTVTSHPLVIYNAGIPGASPITERRMLRVMAPRMRPDAVVVGVFEGNDFQDGWHAEGRADWRNELDDLETADLTDIETYLRGVTRFRFWGATSSAVQLLRLDALLLRVGLVNPIARSNPFLDECLLREPPAVVVEIRDRLIEHLEAIAAQCEQLDAALIVLLIPDAIQVSEQLFAEVAAHRGEGSAPLSRVDFHHGFAAELQRRGFTVVDTLAALEEADRAGRPGYHREGHWNARGHAIAARLLTPVLRDALAR